MSRLRGRIARKGICKVEDMSGSTKENRTGERLLSK